MGDRPALCDRPPVPTTRFDELVDEPRFADTGLADDADDLSASGTGLRASAGQPLELFLPADEASQMADGGGTKARRTGDAPTSS